MNHFAVIFTASVANTTDPLYATTSKRLRELAQEQPGYLGIECLETADREITISYWKSLEAIAAWRNNHEHKTAIYMGKTLWYKDYDVKVVEIHRHYHSENLA